MSDKIEWTEEKLLELGRRVETGRYGLMKLRPCKCGGIPKEQMYMPSTDLQKMNPKPEEFFNGFWVAGPRSIEEISDNVIVEIKCPKCGASVNGKFPKQHRQVYNEWNEKYGD